MKRTVRRGAFETNSSSTHSLTICTEEAYEIWKNNEALYMDGFGKLMTYDEIAAIAKASEYFTPEDPNSKEELDEFIKDWYGLDYMTSAYYNDYVIDHYEQFERKFETPNGDKMVAFGYFGRDF